MKPYIFILLSFFSGAIIGCSILSGNDDPSAVYIRLGNVSPYNYQNIRVSTSGEAVNYGDLASGEFSEYKAFEIAYRYGFVELEINGNTYTLQPIDYVGETPLSNGWYTYQVNANDSDERFSKLSLSLVKE